MKVYITGINGAIGKSITDNFSKRKCVEIANSEETDVCDYQAIYDDLVYFNPDVVINCAAIVGSNSCDVAGQYAVRVNVEGAYNVALACKRRGIRLVHFSSTAIYDPMKNPIYEDTEKTPRTLYGATKLASEQIVRTVYGDKNLLIIRPSFIYSPNDKTDFQKSIKALISAALDNKPQLILHLDPMNRKTYTHTDDFCEILFRLINMKAIGDFNISCGQNNAVMLKDIVAKLKHLGINPNVYYRSSEDYMRNHVVSCHKSSLYTKYYPKHNVLDRLEEMVKVVKNGKN